MEVSCELKKLAVGDYSAVKATERRSYIVINEKKVKLQKEL